MSKRKTSCEPGQSLIYDGVLCTITDRSWEREESPQIVTHNGKDLPPSTITRYRCMVDICKPDGARARLVVVPPFLNDQAHLTPVCVETFSPITYTAGIGGTGTLNASVTFAEGGFTRRCFVEELPLSGAIGANHKQTGAGRVPPQWRHVKKTFTFNDNGVIKHIEVEGDTEEERQENARSELKRIMQKGMEATKRKNQIVDEQIRTNEARFKTPDGWKPPRECGFALYESKKRKHRAYLCDIKTAWRDYETSNPVRILFFRMVWGRHDVADVELVFEGEALTSRTAQLEPRNIQEVSILKWKVTFTDSTVQAMDFCKFTPIKDMAVIRNSVSVQRIIEEHFPVAETKQTKKRLTQAQLEARRGGGKARAQLTTEEIKVIVQEFSFIKNQTATRKGELVAQRCASGLWKHNENLRTKIERKDGKEITSRYVCGVVREYRRAHG